MITAIVLALLVAQTPPPPVTVTKISAPEKALRFEVIIPGSLDEVWNAFTTTDGLSTWLWRDVRVDPRVGGEWMVLYPGGKTGGGTIVSIDAKKQITMRAMAPEQFPTVRETRTTARFEFSAVTTSTTKVTLVQTGWQESREWDDAYEYLAGGNATLLGQLHRRFASGPAVWPKD